MIRTPLHFDSVSRGVTEGTVVLGSVIVDGASCEGTRTQAVWPPLVMEIPPSGQSGELWPSRHTGAPPSMITKPLHLDSISRALIGLTGAGFSAGVRTQDVSLPTVTVTPPLGQSTDLLPSRHTGVPLSMTTRPLHLAASSRGVTVVELDVLVGGVRTQVV
jgi:hypothetical protein